MGEGAWDQGSVGGPQARWRHRCKTAAREADEPRNRDASKGMARTDGEDYGE